MATLDKLAIRGVRSFDDKGLSIIQFFTPLTVIIGYNGSGKTTIIEALKYVTTGDMPSNTKGGAFIHDPKIAASNEVKAQVRLRFHSADKTRFNCVRNVQVTVKKGGGLTMKTLEGLLQIDDPERARNKVNSKACAHRRRSVIQTDRTSFHLFLSGPQYPQSAQILTKKSLGFLVCRRRFWRM